MYRETHATFKREAIELPPNRETIEVTVLPTNSSLKGFMQVEDCCQYRYLQPPPDRRTMIDDKELKCGHRHRISLQIDYKLPPVWRGLLVDPTPQNRINTLRLPYSVLIAFHQIGN